jgi:UDP-N-acetylglucosamine--N-acetylmuramyl-(pentapeptide) pyrophosphoryl-undecaprenol N-acetylglucosamine transferase
MRLMITGGGTAGHTSPAVAILEEIQKRDAALELVWVGRRGNIEERVCSTLTIPFRSVAVRGWPRGGVAGRVWVLMQLGVGAVQSFVHLRRFRPQVVLGVGGYVSLPLIYVAQRMGIPSVLHEQNKRLGLANRLLAKRATKLLLSFSETAGDFPADRALVVGNPVRAGFLSPPTRAEACARLGIDPARPTVLVVGGSQGARTLNEALAGVLEHVEPHEMQFIWMTGRAGLEDARKTAAHTRVNVYPFAFIDDMPAACAAASLIVSRAGASSTAEIATLGKPSVLVPYPHATDNHQEANARAFEAAGAAVVILDRECTSERLRAAIAELLGDRARLDRMGEAARGLAKPAAVESIVETVFTAAFPGDRT